MAFLWHFSRHFSSQDLSQKLEFAKIAKSARWHSKHPHRGLKTCGLTFKNQIMEEKCKNPFFPIFPWFFKVFLSGNHAHLSLNAHFPSFFVHFRVFPVKIWQNLIILPWATFPACYTIPSNHIQQVQRPWMYLAVTLQHRSVMWNSPLCCTFPLYTPK